MKPLAAILLLCAGCAHKPPNDRAVWLPPYMLMQERQRPLPTPPPAMAAMAAAMPQPKEKLQGWTWACPDWRTSTFQFISRTNLNAGPWVVVTNVVNTNVVYLPIRYNQEFLTIGATWDTSDPSNKAKWEGWK